MLNIILGWLLIGLNESFIILKFLLVKFCVLISQYFSGKWKWRVPAQQQAAGSLTTSCNNTRLLLGSVTTEETCELILYNKKNLSELSLFSINLPLDMYNYFYKKKNIIFIVDVYAPTLTSQIFSSLQDAGRSFSSHNQGRFIRGYIWGEILKTFYKWYMVIFFKAQGKE